MKLAIHFMLNSDMYTEFFYQTVSKIQRNLNVQNSTLPAHETGRNFPLKCRGVWFSPVFGVRYIPLQCPAIVCQHTWGPLALVPLFHGHNVWWNLSPRSSLTSPRFSGNNSSVTPEVDFQTHIASHSFVRIQQVLHNILIVHCFMIS